MSFGLRLEIAKLVFPVLMFTLTITKTINHSDPLIRRSSVE